MGATDANAVANLALKVVAEERDAKNTRIEAPDKTAEVLEEISKPTFTR